MSVRKSINAQFDRDAFLSRFEAITGGKPYAWAARHGVPKHTITSIREGAYMPQRKTRDLIEAKTGIRAEWLFFGEGLQWLPERGPLPNPTNPHPTRLEARQAKAGYTLSHSEATPHTARMTRAEMMAAGLDLVLFEKVCRVIDTYFGAAKLKMSTDDEAHISRILYERFLPRREQVTEEDMLAFMEVVWHNPPSASTASSR